MKQLTTAGEYPYAYVVGQKVRFKPLLSIRMVEAYIVKLPDDDNAMVRTRDGKLLRKPLKSLFADASVVKGEKYKPLTVPWKQHLLQKIRLTSIDPFLVEAIWTYVNDVVFHRRMVMPLFLVERQPGFIKGRFYPDKKLPSFGSIAVDPGSRVGLNGLASIVAHEAMHQWQYMRNGTGGHDPFFMRLMPQVTQLTGIKIFVTADEESDAEFEMGLHLINSEYDVFHLFVKPKASRWTGAVTTKAAIAMDAFDVFAADPENDVRLYKARDLALTKLMANLDEQVSSGDTHYRLEYTPEMLHDYALDNFDEVKHKPINPLAR